MVRNREEQKERGGKKESQNQPLHQENKALFMREITVWVQEYFWRHTEKKALQSIFVLSVLWTNNSVEPQALS